MFWTFWQFLHNHNFLACVIFQCKFCILMEADDCGVISVNSSKDFERRNLNSRLSREHSLTTCQLQLPTELTTVDLENFSEKNLYTAVAHTLTTMKFLLSNNQYHASSFYSKHSHTLNVSDNNVYEAQTSTSFMIIKISVQEDGAVKVLQRIKYLIKRVFSKQNTFPAVLQSRPIKSFNKPGGLLSTNHANVKQ